MRDYIPYFGVGLFGLGVGLITGIYLGKRYFQDEYELLDNIEDDDLEELTFVYKDSEPVNETTKEKKEVLDKVENPKEEKPVRRKLADEMAAYPHSEKEIERVEEAIPNFDMHKFAPEPDPNYVYPVNMNDLSANLCEINEVDPKQKDAYFIDWALFEDNEYHNTQVTMTYFPIDEIMLDEQERMFDHETNGFGPVLRKIPLPEAGVVYPDGERPTERTIVYVRNNGIGMDVEVCLEWGSYEDYMDAVISHSYLDYDDDDDW